MKKFITTSIILLSVISISNKTNAQGCVAIRQMGGVTAVSESNTYNLGRGEFQIGANYRYFHSFRHYVGTIEQPQRQTTGGGHDANGNERGNAVNIYSHSLDLNLSYGLTKRWQLNLSIPYVHNERSQVLRQSTPVKDTFRYSVYAQGFGDVRISANYWVFNPSTAMKGNLMVGFGLKLPTGNHNVTDDAPQSDGTVKNVTMDQAIQPGDGGLGFSIEVQGFKKIYKNLYAFGNAYYLVNPRQSNGSFKSDPNVVKDKDGNVLDTLFGYNIYACPDQYFLRAGFMIPVDKAKKLTASLAYRWEGIPAFDVIGGQVAYRRPGYVMAIEPGLSFRTEQHTLSLFVPYNICRNRIQSAADLASQNLQNSVIADKSQQVRVQGDAAFADYSINIGYSFRIPSMKKHSDK